MQAFILWDCVLNVLALHSFHSTPATENRSKDISVKPFSKQTTLGTFDLIPSTISTMPNHSHLFLFEDSEAVIETTSRDLT